MISKLGPAVLATALMLVPLPSRGQCAMMGGSGGHDHSTQAAPKVDAGEKKQRQAIERLIADPRGRALLLEAVLADAELVRSLMDRIAQAPEWRALAGERLATAGTNAPATRPDSVRASRPAPPPPPAAALYRCPMHAEVTSRRPGSCSKCGMALRRDT